MYKFARRIQRYLVCIIWEISDPVKNSREPQNRYYLRVFMHSSVLMFTSFVYSIFRGKRGNNTRQLFHYNLIYHSLVWMYKHYIRRMWLYNELRSNRMDRTLGRCYTSFEYFAFCGWNKICAVCTLNTGIYKTYVYVTKDTSDFDTLTRIVIVYVV